MILPISAELETKLQRLLNPGTSDHSTYLHIQLLEFVVYKNFKSCGFVMLLHILLCQCASKIHFCVHVFRFAISQDLILIVSSTLGTIRLYYDWTD